MEIQEMAIAAFGVTTENEENLSISTNQIQFRNLMEWLAKIFGGKHRVSEYATQVLEFKTTWNEEPVDIVFRWRKAKLKLALQLEMKYATECNVAERNRLQLSDA